MELSKRLGAVKDMVDNCDCLCDVGCDHGYLPIELVRTKKAKTAIACDINQGPLDRAKNNIIKEGLSDKIELRLSDGLLSIEKNEVDAITVCGMGGMLIAEIVTNGKEVIRSAKQIIVSPQSDVYYVRRLFCEINLDIIDEEMVCDDGKFYPIIKATPKKEREEKKKITLLDGTNSCGKESQDNIFEDENLVYDRYGRILIKKGHPVLKEFLEKEIIRYEKILSALPSHARQRRKEVTEKLNEAKQAICMIDKNNDC